MGKRIIGGKCYRKGDRELKLNPKIEKFKIENVRSRIKPNIFDFSYVMTKNSHAAFRTFKRLVEKKDRAKILDVGCGFKPWALLFDETKFSYIGIDAEAISSADAIASAEELPFPDHHFDALIYSEILEHIGDLEKALLEMRRVSKKGALVFISAPFFFYEHGVPDDFQRLTRYAYERYFQKDEIILLKASNGILANPFLMGNLIYEITPLRKVPILSHFIYFLNNLLALLMEYLARFAILLLANLSPSKSFVEKVVHNTYCFPLGYAVLLRIE